MFRTKICGITSKRDAEMIAQSGVDAVGLNFYEKSKRYIEPAMAQQLVGALRNVERVGVFVNASIDFILEAFATSELNFVQLHGDEDPDFFNHLSRRLGAERIIRAFRCQNQLEPVRDYLSACKQQPAAVLVDAYDPNEFGGTGKTLNWPDLANAREYLGDIPLILAGGLTPANVSQAILLAHPAGVDTASGVESSPGIKQETQCRRFVEEANRAFSS